jgi:hypothetical protein
VVPLGSKQLNSYLQVIPPTAHRAAERHLSQLARIPEIKKPFRHRACLAFFLRRPFDMSTTHKLNAGLLEDLGILVNTTTDSDLRQLVIELGDCIEQSPADPVEALAGGMIEDLVLAIDRTDDPKRVRFLIAETLRDYDECLLVKPNAPSPAYLA